jgi:hypothetical protein
MWSAQKKRRWVHPCPPNLARLLYPGTKVTCAPWQLFAELFCFCTSGGLCTLLVIPLTFCKNLDFFTSSLHIFRGPRNKIISALINLKIEKCKTLNVYYISYISYEKWEKIGKIKISYRWFEISDNLLYLLHLIELTKHHVIGYLNVYLQLGRWWNWIILQGELHKSNLKVELVSSCMIVNEKCNSLRVAWF